MDKIGLDAWFDSRTLEVSLLVFIPGQREHGAEITMSAARAKELQRQLTKAIAAAEKHPAQPGAPRYAHLHGGKTLKVKKVEQ